MIHSIFLSSMSGGKHCETKFIMVKDYLLWECPPKISFVTQCVDASYPHMTKRETDSWNKCKLSFQHSLLCKTTLGIQTSYPSHANIHVQTSKAWYSTGEKGRITHFLLNFSWTYIKSEVFMATKCNESSWSISCINTTGSVSNTKRVLLPVRIDAADPVSGTNCIW